MQDRANNTLSISNPEELLVNCRNVLNELHSQIFNKEVILQELQLKEIMNTIHRMESKKIPIPYSLREEKIKIVMALNNIEEAKRNYSTLLYGLNDIVNSYNLDEVIKLKSKKKNVKKYKFDTKYKQKLLISRRLNIPPKTNSVNNYTKEYSNIIRGIVISSLKNIGGKVNRKELFIEMEKLLREIIPSEHLLWKKESNEFLWMKITKNMRYYLVKEGIISPYGSNIWELTKDSK